MESNKKNWLRSVIPGIVTAALVFGPSKMTITSQLGSHYGYALLWIVAVAIVFMRVYTGMASRIGMATNASILDIIRQKRGKFTAALIGCCVFLATASFQAGNSVGTGISIGELTGISSALAIGIFTLLAICLLFFRSFYRLLEIFMTFMVIVMLFSFVATMLLADVNWALLFAGFKPTLPSGSETLVIAFIASCFSVVGAFYQSYLVQEKRRSQSAGQQTQKDNSTAGMLTLGLMSMIVMICGAAILHPAGIAVKSASDMGRALEPLFGPSASNIFLIGLFAASFSSLVGNAVVGGTLLADGLGYGHSFGSRQVRLCTALVMVIGAVIAILFGKAPLQLIVVAQAITVFITPVIGLSLFLIARDKPLMGIYTNNRLSDVLGALGLLLILILATAGFKNLFF